MAWTLSRLAERLGARLEGDGDRAVESVRPLAEAGPSDLSFLQRNSFLPAARTSAAGALLVGEHHADIAAAQLVVADVMAALTEAVGLLHPEPRPEPGVHPTAVVGRDCEIDPTSALGPYAVVGDGVRIGARSILGAHVVVGDRCEIGSDVELDPHVVLYRRVRVGDGTLVHAGTVLGADGFGYASSAAGHCKVPQVGDVAIGSAVEIGALSAVDRATLGTTRVGDGTKIDNLVQVGHNVDIGRDAILCGQAGVAGSARLGDGVVLGGQAGVAGHLTVGDRVQVASKSAVYDEVAAGETVAGIPAVPIGKWRRQQSLLRRIGEIWRRLRALEEHRAAGREAGEDS